MTLHNGIRIKECAGLKHLRKLDFLDIQLFDRAMEQKHSWQYILLCLLHQQIKRVDQIPACRIISSFFRRCKTTLSRNLILCISSKHSFFLVNHFLVCGFWFPTKRFLNGMSYVINDSYCTVRFLQLVL